MGLTQYRAIKLGGQLRQHWSPEPLTQRRRGRSEKKSGKEESETLIFTNQSIATISED